MRPALLIPVLAGAAWAPHARAACPEPTSTADVQSALDAAEGQFANLDVDGFRASTDRAMAALPCVSDPVPRHLAAEVHRYRGLRAFLDRDPETSTRAFAAARSIEPAYTFPTSLVPEGNPVLADYTAIDPASGRVEAVPEPATGRIQFDGRATTERPSSFPTIVQLFDEAGAVLATAYVAPGEALPAYEPKPIQSPLPTDPVEAERHPLRVPLAVAAGTAAVASGLSFALASKAHHDYWEPGGITDPNALDAQRGKTNALVVVSAAAGATALGCGAGVVLVGAF